MSQTKGILAMLALAVLLAACTKRAQEATPPTRPLPRPGVKFVATPNSGPACGAFNFRVHFDWEVTAPQAGNDFDIRVDSPIGSTFASGNRIGHADTGDWAHVGQWFYLADPHSGEVVAAVRIGPDDCIQ